MPDEPPPPPSTPAPHGREAGTAALRGAVIRAQAAILAHRDASLERLEAGAGAGLWSCRLRDGALDWSGGVYDLFGFGRGLTLHRPQVIALFEPASRRLVEALRARALRAGGSFAVDAEITTARGQNRWIRIRAAVERADGRPVRIFGTKQDVTAEVTRLAELSRRAERDPLTGLPNRRAFEARLCRPEPPGALLLIDLDGFKAVNDTRGHAAGDACLRRAAARLARICREADLVARIGGDEFAVLVSPPAGTEALARLGGHIVAGLGRPLGWDGAPIRIGASVGIARAGPACTPQTLFAEADAALYAAKASGRGAVRLAGAAA